MDVIYTRQAIHSMDELYAFMKSRLGIKKTHDLFSQIIKQADSLSKNPLIGQAEPLLDHLNQGHRRIIFGHTKIIYLIQKKTIFIIDVFDSRQDPKKMKS